jgi:ABC-type proline/glycine betaine transport system substrate-binding protein
MIKLLFFTFLFAFTATVSAQKLPSTKDLKKDTLETVSKEKPNVDDQVKKALMKDEGLQKETINYLKSNPETAKSLAGMAVENKGSNSGLMKSILGDKDLSAAAIDFITKNPKLLNKAMKFVGM